LALRKQKDGSSLETVLLGSIIAAVAGLPFLLRAQPTGLDLGILVFLGIFQLGIPMIIYAVALRQLSAIEAILIQMLEPILNPIWVFLVVGEQPGGRALLGGALVLVSVTARGVLSATQRRRVRNGQQPVVQDA
jgi:drug/metabolite transporter (DMT)-like permease